jgi:hypothetical protein
VILEEIWADTKHGFKTQLVVNNHMMILSLAGTPVPGRRRSDRDEPCEINSTMFFLQREPGPRYDKVPG